MSERYTRIFLGENNLYTEGAPVIVKACALLKDNVTEKLIAQLKFQNVSSKKITYLKVYILQFDSIKKQLGEPITFEYLDICIFNMDEFGSKTPIYVPNASTRAFSVLGCDVGFDDGSVWTCEKSVWLPSAEDSNIVRAIKTEEMYQEACRLYQTNNIKKIQEAIDLFKKIETERDVVEKIEMCFKTIEEIKRSILLSAKDKIKVNKISSCEEAIRMLSTIKGFEDADEQMALCEEKIEELKVQASAKKSKVKSKVKKVTIFSSIGIVIFALIGFFVLYPLISFLSGNYSVYINMYKVKTFEIPEGVTVIESYEFADCSSLTNVVIPDGVTSIDEYSFFNCSNLTSITIPDSVTNIGTYAFSACRNLTSITIPDSVISIGFASFKDCSGLTSITIPDSLTIIGGSAFIGCSGLSSIAIPGSVTSIGNYAFSACSSLTSITIPDSVTSIGGYAFYNCSSLTSITIPDSVTSVGDCAFFGCGNLKGIYYCGTFSEWNSVVGSDAVYGATIYYYSEEKPILNRNYWHYVDGVPTVWGNN